VAGRLLGGVPIVFSHLLRQASVPHLAMRDASPSVGEVVSARLWVPRGLRVPCLSRRSVASLSRASWALVIAKAAAISRPVAGLCCGLPAPQAYLSLPLMR